MQTASFFNPETLKHRCLSIARYQPKGKNFGEAKELAPTSELMKRNYSYEEYVDLLESRKLTAKDILEKYNDYTLLCWEHTREACHRGYLARWIEEKTGQIVPELHFEKAPKKKSSPPTSLLLF